MAIAEIVAKNKLRCDLCGGKMDLYRVESGDVGAEDYLYFYRCNTLVKKSDTADSNVNMLTGKGPCGRTHRFVA